MTAGTEVYIPWRLRLRHPASSWEMVVCSTEVRGKHWRRGGAQVNISMHLAAPTAGGPAEAVHSPCAGPCIVRHGRIRYSRYDMGP